MAPNEPLMLVDAGRNETWNQLFEGIPSFDTFYRVDSLLMLIIFNNRPFCQRFSQKKGSWKEQARLPIGTRPRATDRFS